MNRNLGALLTDLSRGTPTHQAEAINQNIANRSSKLRKGHKMKNSENKAELLTILKDGGDKYFQAGLSGRACATFPNLTVETTEEEELQMIYESIENLRLEQGLDVHPPEVLEVLVLFCQLLADSYRKGLVERNSIEECTTEGESA